MTLEIASANPIHNTDHLTETHQSLTEFAQQGLTLLLETNKALISPITSLIKTSLDTLANASDSIFYNLFATAEQNPTLATTIKSAADLSHQLSQHFAPDNSPLWPSRPKHDISRI